MKDSQKNKDVLKTLKLQFLPKQINYIKFTSSDLSTKINNRKAVGQCDSE